MNADTTSDLPEGIVDTQSLESRLPQTDKLPILNICDYLPDQRSNFFAGFPDSLFLICCSFHDPMVVTVRIAKESGRRLRGLRELGDRYPTLTHGATGVRRLRDWGTLAQTEPRTFNGWQLEGLVSASFAFLLFR